MEAIYVRVCVCVCACALLLIECVHMQVHYKGKNACQWKRCQWPGGMMRAHQHPYGPCLTSPSRTDKNTLTYNTVAYVFPHSQRLVVAIALKQQSSICDTEPHCEAQSYQAF